MHTTKHIASAFSLLVLCALWGIGCDGKGLFVGDLGVSAGDQPPSDNSSNNENGTAVTDTRFAGSWVASYGDDRVTSVATLSAVEYATQISLTQDGTSLSGTGTMFRVFHEGSVAHDEIAVKLTGTASGDSATLVVRSSVSGSLANSHVWNMRLASGRLVGMFAETDSSSALVRSGHAAWYRVSSADVADAWAGGFSDVYGVAGYPVEDRTWLVTLSTGTGNALSGVGSFVTQRDDVTVDQAFNVTRGELLAPKIGFSFGGEDLAAIPMDVFGFFNGSLIVIAYDQFDASETLLRNGHGILYRSPVSGPSAVTHAWTSSFSDAVVATGLHRADYLGVMTLQAQDGGSVTGTARILGEDADSPEFETFDVENATIVGSQLDLDLQGLNSKFIWNLRVASSALVGSYRQVDNAGQFVSRGTGEWRYSASVSQVGTWVASYEDTYGATVPESSQFSMVTISTLDTDGVLSGVGTLRYAGEGGRRQFSVTGSVSVSGSDIDWTWSGGDLSGDTLWHLRQGSNMLFGTYTNLDSGGTVEARGHALWVRTSTTQTLTK